MNVDVVTKEEFEQFKNELLTEIKRMNTRPEPEKRFLKSKEMMKKLGCCENHLRHLRITGELKARKLGGEWMYDYQAFVSTFEK